jgi:hypothetical protein
MSSIIVFFFCCKQLSWTLFCTQKKIISTQKSAATGMECADPVKKKIDEKAKLEIEVLDDCIKGYFE